LFESIFIQDELKEKFVNAIESKRVPHAIFLKGKEGSGNLPIAIALANELLNQDKSMGLFGEPKKDDRALELKHPDLNIVFPVQQLASKKQVTSEPFINDFREYYQENPYMSFDDWLNRIGHEDKKPIISVHEAVAILKKLSLKSFEGGYQVLIIWKPELMNLECANKLLKIIEEPEPKNVIIMVGDNWDNLLATIKSRVQLIRTKPFSANKIEGWLRNNYDIEESRVIDIAKKAGGIPGEAIRLKEELINEDTLSMLDVWLKACSSYNQIGIIDLADKFHSLNKIEKQNFLIEVLNRIQIALVNDKLRIDQCDSIQKIAEKAIYSLSRNAHVKTLFLDLSLRTCKILNRLPKG